MEIGITHYLFVSAILFAIGIFGIFLNRKNTLITLMSLEIVLLSVNLNFVAFSQQLNDLMGQVFALFVLTVAAAKVVIGVAILMVLFRNNEPSAVEDISELKG